MPKGLAIITGGSKGIGLALCKQYLKNKYTVYNLSRSFTNISNELLHQISVDLSDIDLLEHKIASTFKEIAKQKWDEVLFIQNAGRLGEINHLQNLCSVDFQKTIHVNYTSAVLLTQLFIESFKKISNLKKIVFIGSGAASNPYDGWSIYCSTKAALEHFAATVGKEQDQTKNGCEITTIRPGVVNTAMQQQIRCSTEEQFSQKEKFTKMHQEDKLFTADYVAALLFDYLKNTPYTGYQNIDLRKL